MYFNFKVPIDDFRLLMAKIGEEGSHYLKEENEKDKIKKSYSYDETEEINPEELNNPYPEDMIFPTSIDLKTLSSFCQIIGEEGIHYLEEELETKKSFRSSPVRKEEAKEGDEEEISPEEINNPFPEDMIFPTSIDLKTLSSFCQIIGEEGIHYLEEELETKKSFRSSPIRKEEAKEGDEEEISPEEINNPFPEDMIFPTSIDLKTLSSFCQIIGEEGIHYLEEELETKKSFRSSPVRKEETKESDEEGDEEVSTYTPFPEMTIFKITSIENNFSDFFEAIGEEGVHYLEQEEENSKSKFKKRTVQTEDEANASSPFPDSATPFPETESANPFPEVEAEGENVDLDSFDDIDDLFDEDEEESSFI